MSVATYPLQDSPFGRTWSDWNATWCIWCFEQPLSSNPANDPTGGLCTNKQGGPVWFLAGTLGGIRGTIGGPGTLITRKCTVPTGKAIFFPMIMKIKSNAEFPQDVPLETLRATASSPEMDTLTTRSVVVDGTVLLDSQIPRVPSVTPFYFAVPPLPGNAFGARPGLTQAMSDGYWVFLMPLPPGPHTIRITAQHSEEAAAGGVFFIDVLYNLTVL